MIVDIDRWVIVRALDQLAELSEAGRACRFAINLSEQSLREPDTVEFVRVQLAQRNLVGNCLTLEVSEACAIANVDTLGRMITELKALGCRVGLDKFGTGFASFHHLKDLDVDYLKIDGHYLRGVITDPINSALLGAIAKIAHVLGKQTIAECVDSVSIVQALENSGVDQLQGFFIGRPREQIEQLTLGLADTRGSGKVTPIRGQRR